MKKSNKVVITSLSLLLVLGGCSNGQTSGSTPKSTTQGTIEVAPAVIKAVQIDETHFPDDVFQNYIRYEFDEDEDDILSEDEIRQATEVEVDYSDIKSLKGIEYLRELTTLSCSGADLTELDVSENRELLTLRCPGNALSSLNVQQYEVESSGGK